MKEDLFRDRHPLLHALEHRPMQLAGACLALLLVLWLSLMLWAITAKVKVTVKSEGGLPAARR